MEFRFRSGEAKDDPSLLSSSSDGYFASQALRAGLAGIGGDIGRSDLLQDRIAAREKELHRELQKQRIREEIIAREITEKRLLEAEVRREMAIERAMGIGRLHPETRIERLLHLVPEIRVGGRLGSGLVTHRPKVGVDEGLVPPVRSEAAIGKKFLPFTEVKPLKPTICGTKRKVLAIMGAPQKMGASLKEWSCALCQVHATSKEGLSEHLQGKKHKSKEAMLVVENKVAKVNNGESSLKVDGKNPQLKGSRSHLAQKKQRIIADRRFWCEPCQLQCNSKSNLGYHIRGKKHHARLEKFVIVDKLAAVATTSGVEKEEIEAQTTQKESDEATQKESDEAVAVDAEKYLDEAKTGKA